MSQEPGADQAPESDAAPSEALPQIKAASAKRANATVMGMLIATGITLGLAILLPLLSPLPSGSQIRPTVDAQEIAGQAQDAAGFRTLAPLPEGWSVNYARWNGAGSDGVASWEIGYTTADQRFATLVQTAQPNPTWLATRTDAAPETGDREFAGANWNVRDKVGTATSWVGALPDSTVVLRVEVPQDAPKQSSNANFAALETLAAAVQQKNSAPTTPAASPAEPEETGVAQ